MSNFDEIFRPHDDFSADAIRRKRKFPVGKTVLLCILIVIQISAILFAVFYTPKPQDVINIYNVDVFPQSDGNLLVDYSITWTPLDPDEPITWIEIGMANESYDLISVYGPVSSHKRFNDGYGYFSHRFYLDKGYRANETFTVNFSIVQEDLLSKDNSMEYFHRFVPSWFNSIKVENYCFRWYNGDIESKDANNSYTDNEWLVWEGSLDCGNYVEMLVYYGNDAYSGVNTVKDFGFDPSGASNDLQDEKFGVVVFCILLIIVLLIAEIYIFDCFVSYSRGRGFITGYGVHIHHYGMLNPRYVTARNKHIAASGRGGGRSGGGGCACACACACAGGGRAGCSQKDGYVLHRKDTEGEG